MRYKTAQIFLLCVPVLGATGFFGLRWFETAVTYHPTRYQPGEVWRLPAGGEDVWFRARTGERLHGWFVRARKQPATATVLYLHGNGGNITNVAWIGESLAARGLDVLLFDYRGYGRSEGEITDEWGLYADADAAYDYLMNERGVKADRLALYGQSLGTTAAVDVASRKRCAALILESGLSSASDMAKMMLPWLPQWLHGLGRNRFESARKLASITCPVLVTHGTHDGVIPVEQGRALYEAAREPKRLIVIEGAGHEVAGFAGSGYIDSVVDFIRDSTR
ncbi:MAG TPA: alpha/beta hydrolase [Blastocatellia bacterium]|nr:alpha/beta hydrolase [Blastocatellia bacterium]